MEQGVKNEHFTSTSPFTDRLKCTCECDVGASFG